MQVAHLSLAAQTAFAQLAEAVLTAEHLRTVAQLPGAFTSKQVKGHKYWYYQYTEPSGARRQIFVGPDNETVRALVSKSNQAADSDIKALVAAALAHGCSDVLPRHFKVLRQLSNYGFFRGGGVLIGTHAFVAYANLLGVRWSSADVSRTQDIDFAHAGKNISLALAADFEVRTHEAIESLEMGFLPISGLTGRTGGAYLIPNEKEFRLDFLTTARRGGNAPYEHPDLHVTLQPVKFMEYSLVDVQQTILLSGAGAILVNVPHPARYALHKLIVAGEREGAFVTKTGKDYIQSALLLRVLRDERPWEVESAWHDLKARGKGWLSRALRGLAVLDKKYPAEQFGAWLA